MVVCSGKLTVIAVQVRLYGSLRELLPREQKGEATLTLSDGATLRDLKAAFDFPRPVVFAINEEPVDDELLVLSDGDRVAVFSIVSGGRR